MDSILTRALILAATTAITGASVATGASGRLLLSGQVEATNPTNGTIVVLGRVVRSRYASSVVVGQFVNVYGVVGRSGDVEDAQLETVPAFAIDPNARFLLGEVTQIDLARNTAMVSGVLVNYSRLLNSLGQPSISVGDQVSVEASQVASGDALEVRTALLSGGSERGALLSGGSERGALLSGGSERGALLSGGSERGALLSGGSADSE